MKRYISELKKVKWPSQNEVFAFFWIVIIGIIGIVLFTFLIDSVVLEFLNKLYN